MDARGICRRQYYVVRVNRQLALLGDSDLPDGKGWEQFTTIDLWQTLTLKSLLANIVQDQAQQLPRAVFREVTE
ncbi:hypothetical protein [Streptomyces sp. AK02-04a]|uniref:hypothetical protein n=1 Tax=Streptomyces sp. AK02-04a TaxID=3028649 RepID=UPI0029A3F5DE|nr:hypothetical protein [Streptomyces sp. AK02-04a]MDX3762772.1 hypothetical protein [Streptomyces sp. AK02-04a]